MLPFYAPMCCFLADFPEISSYFPLDFIPLDSIRIPNFTCSYDEVRYHSPRQSSSARADKNQRENAPILFEFHPGAAAARRGPRKDRLDSGGRRGIMGKKPLAGRVKERDRRLL